MLQITVPAMEFYDNATGSFINRDEQKLELEHSLISLSRWESKWKKAFLADPSHTNEEMRDYIRCMTINQKAIPEDYYNTIDVNIIKQVEAYINDPHTATIINSRSQRHYGRQQTITSELIYSWMVSNDIPFSCEKWHLNRLITLIRICEIHKEPLRKMGRKDIYAQNRALNAKRRAALHSRG